MIHLMYLNGLYEFGSIELNPKKHQKNAKLRYGTVELFQQKYGTVGFGAVLSARKLHCIYTDFLIIGI